MSLRKLSILALYLFAFVTAEAQFAVDSIIKKSLSQTPVNLTTKKTLLKKLPTRFDSLKSNKPTLIISNPIKKGGIKFRGGNLIYNYSYRGYIDTPFLQNNLSQHYAMGNLNFSVGVLPVRVNYLIRKSNSPYFRDITDIRVEYDAGLFKANATQRIKEKLLSYGEKFKDSLLLLDYHLTEINFNKLAGAFNIPSLEQKYAESIEILNVPALSYDAALGDSANQRRVDSTQKEARFFIDTYTKQKEQIQKVKNRLDSLTAEYQKMVLKLHQYQNFVQSKFNKGAAISEVQQGLKAYGVTTDFLSPKDKFLLNIRKVSLGRTMANYSELTTKNASVNGLNMEYQGRKFYAAFMVGLVDFRYRDFIVNQYATKAKQYIVLARIGKGTVEGNHLFLTAYKGQKSILPSSNVGNAVLPITGVAMEVKYKLTKMIDVLGEVAESSSQDFKTAPISKSTYDFTNEKNKALSIKVNGNFPQTHTKFSAAYKYTGANFQSFSTFQNNAAQKAWQVKVDQSLFKRKVKIAAMLRVNDFTNPYIEQRYANNTVFKSVQVTYRAKHMPMLSVGYIPMTQLTKLGDKIVENNFTSFNAVASHFYKLGTAKAATTLMYNQFFNAAQDSGFAYYNATNFYFSHRVDFDFMVMSWGATLSKNVDYSLGVLDGGLEWRIHKAGSIGFGVKVNNFNKTLVQTSGYAQIKWTIKKVGMLMCSFDNGFIPDGNRQFVRNTMFNTMLVTSF